MGGRESRLARLHKPASRADETTFLRVLGERVREARARRGMSRKTLAQDSGVSERYLAQLESGQGNISVLLLRQICIALSLPLTELLREDSSQSVELALIDQFLKRLAPPALAKVREKLMHDFGSSPSDRMKRIALIGLRGAR